MTFDSNFRMSISTAQALGYDEPDDVKKSKEDIISDLDYQDRQFEGFLSSFAQSTVSTGVWVSYTPTIIGTGWVLGDGTLVGERVYNGETVCFVARFTLGPTSVAGVGNLGFALPATADISPVPIESYVLDASSGSQYGSGGKVETTFAYPLLNGASGVLTPIVAGTPVTFSTGDVVVVVGTYKKA